MTGSEGFRETRWLIGLLVAFGTMVTVHSMKHFLASLGALLGIAQFTG